MKQTKEETGFVEVPASEYDKFEGALAAQMRYSATGVDRENMIFIYGIPVVRGERQGDLPDWLGPVRQGRWRRAWSAVQAGEKIESMSDFLKLVQPA